MSSMDAGPVIPPWAGRRAQEARGRVRRLGRLNDLPCAICGQPIDYELTYPHPDSVSVQHLKSQALFPGLRWDPSNWAPAHLQCNQAEGGAGGPALELGVTSEEW